MVFPLAKTACKVLWQEAFETGKNVAKDVLAGENLTTSIEKHGNKDASNLIEEAAKRTTLKIQRGKGLGIRGR